MAPEKMWREWRKYWQLAVFGVAFNAAIWVDKFLFWWLDASHRRVAEGLYASPIYDLATCLSILSIIPGIAVFLLKLETVFAQRFWNFYDRLRNRATYGELTKLKGEMISSLRQGVILLLKVQGLVTLCCMAFAPVIAERLGMGMLQRGVFETLLLGSFILILLQSMLAVLFYLDRRLETLVCALIFLGTNFAVTWWNIQSGESYYGLGFLAGTSVRLAVAAENVEGGRRGRAGSRSGGFEAGRFENGFDLAGADHGVHLGNVLLNLVAVALDQAAGDDQFFG